MQELSISISQLLRISSSIAMLIALAIGALWSIYFNRIKEGQKLEFDKQLEILKSKNEKINYITKAQFDAEFKMYQELSEASFKLIVDILPLFQKFEFLPKNVNLIDYRTNIYNDARKTLEEYQHLVFQYAPFIDENLYKNFEILRGMGQRQVTWYPTFFLENNDNSYLSTLKLEEAKCYEVTEKIKSAHELCVEDLRNYLKTLKVHED